MRFSIRQFSEMTGKSRDEVRSSLKKLRHENGPRGAKLYESIPAFQAIFSASADALEEARIREANSRADLNEISLKQKTNQTMPVELATELFFHCRSHMRAKLEAFVRSGQLPREAYNEIGMIWRGAAEEWLLKKGFNLSEIEKRALGERFNEMPDPAAMQRQEEEEKWTCKHWCMVKTNRKAYRQAHGIKGPIVIVDLNEPGFVRELEGESEDAKLKRQNVEEEKFFARCRQLGVSCESAAA
ncbi:MAG TPA: hypothetical protein VG733_02635 [Chthoniobacteraceae bacterium]|nr:hypothetical protein [Chthoniobacteraceae bacterium]